MLADAAFGLVCLLCLPFMKSAKAVQKPAPGAAVPEAIEP